MSIDNDGMENEIQSFIISEKANLFPIKLIINNDEVYLSDGSRLFKHLTIILGFNKKETRKKIRKVISNVFNHGSFHDDEIYCQCRDNIFTLAEDITDFRKNLNLISRKLED